MLRIAIGCISSFVHGHTRRCLLLDKPDTGATESEQKEGNKDLAEEVRDSAAQLKLGLLEGQRRIEDMYIM